jgi:hypothetical protein
VTILLACCLLVDQGGRGWWESGSPPIIFAFCSCSVLRPGTRQSGTQCRCAAHAGIPRQVYRRNSRCRVKGCTDLISQVLPISGTLLPSGPISSGTASRWRSTATRRACSATTRRKPRVAIVTGNLAAHFTWLANLRTSGSFDQTVLALLRQDDADGLTGVGAELSRRVPWRHHGSLGNSS